MKTIKQGKKRNFEYQMVLYCLRASMADSEERKVVHSFGVVGYLFNSVQNEASFLMWMMPLSHPLMNPSSLNPSPFVFHFVFSNLIFFSFFWVFIFFSVSVSLFFLKKKVHPSAHNLSLYARWNQIDRVKYKSKRRGKIARKFDFRVIIAP